MANSSRRQLKAKEKSREEERLSLPQRITELVASESDRGVILILGAYLDEILGILITGACVSDTLAVGLLKHGQPAGTFNNRMVLAQALGLIHEEDVQALRIVQKIRNKAAHFDLSGRGFEVLFDSSITADQVEELSAMFFEPLPDRRPATVRSSFISAARNTASRLLMRRSDTQRPTPPKSTQELIAEALALDAETPIAGMLGRIKERMASPEGKAQYQGIMHMLSKMVLNSRSSTDGNGLPDEMVMAVAEILSRQSFDFPPFDTAEQ